MFSAAGLLMPEDRNEHHEQVPADIVRIAVFTDERLLLEGLERLLRAETSVELVTSCEDADVILIDSAAHSFWETTADGNRAVVLVAAPDDDCWAIDALKRGARGIVPRAAGLDETVRAARAVRDGVIWARRTVLSGYIDYLTGTTSREYEELEHCLSPREREVMRGAVSGLGNKEVAARLSISESTVKVHLTHIFRKLGVQGRTQLAAAWAGAAVRSVAGNGYD
jgi:DNA-binding NarL/FixJ family response regulator